MRIRPGAIAAMVVIGAVCGVAPQANAAARKTHSVVLGAMKRVPYSKTGDPAGAAASEDELKIRALVVDGLVKEWTTGDAHDVTDRSFVVRRVSAAERQPARRTSRATGCGSAGRGCWWIA